MTNIVNLQGIVRLELQSSFGLVNAAFLSETLDVYNTKKLLQCYGVMLSSHAQEVVGRFVYVI